MGALAAAGAIAVAFGVGGYYATGTFGPFSWLNVALGSAALLVAGAARLGSLRSLGAGGARRVLLVRVAAVVAALAVAVALERGLAAFTSPLDWTVNQSFELAPATCQAARALSPLSATLFYERFDPRTRRIRLLLERIADCAPVDVTQRALDEAASEVDRFDIAYSNSVVLEQGDRFAVVERPTEGTLLEGLLQLGGERDAVLYVARGSGEGNLSNSSETGYSGLAFALGNEGYVVRDLVTAAIEEVPEDAAALLLIAPQRSLRDAAWSAFDAYLERGGRMVVLAEPGGPQDLTDFLLRWGFELPDAVVVDPASGPVEGAPPGVNPIAYAYAEHPVTRGLDGDAMTFFLRARPVVPVRKPRPGDRLGAVVYTSPRSFLVELGSLRAGIAPEARNGTAPQRYPLVATGEYPRENGSARIVVAGDAEFAANHYLRALYNLDLILNAVHWVTEQEDRITLRPKALTKNQDPLTPQQTLTMLYGVGLLLPELLLIAGAVVAIRRRSA